MTTLEAILEAIQAMIAKRIKDGYSRNIGTGFIKEDISNIGLTNSDLYQDGTIWLKFVHRAVTVNLLTEFNLRELEEMEKFLLEQKDDSKAG